VLGAARRLVQRNGGALAYMCEVQEMILTGLGAPRERARDAVVFPAAYLDERQAQRPWWRSLELEVSGGQLLASARKAWSAGLKSGFIDGPRRCWAP